MQPDWDSLASAFEDSKKVLIADVDCTAAGKPLCDKYGVRGYPTIKYFTSETAEDGCAAENRPVKRCSIISPSVRC